MKTLQHKWAEESRRQEQAKPNGTTVAAQSQGHKIGVGLMVRVAGLGLQGPEFGPLSAIGFNYIKKIYNI